MGLSVHPVLMVYGKLTWLVVLNGGSNPRLGLSSEFSPPVAVLPRGRITEKEEEMGRWRDARRIDAGAVQ